MNVLNITCHELSSTYKKNLMQMVLYKSPLNLENITSYWKKIYKLVIFTIHIL